MQPGEAARSAAECDRQRAAVAHRVAQLRHHALHARIGRGFLQVAQRAVEVLPGAQHGREFAHEVGDLLLPQAALAAEIDVQQRGRAQDPPAAGSARIGMLPWRCRRVMTSASVAASISPRWTSPPGPIAV